MPNDSEVFFREAPGLVFAKSEINLSEAIDLVPINADLVSDQHKHAAKINRVGTGRLAVCAPVGVDDLFGNVRLKQGRERIDAVQRDPNRHCLAGCRHKQPAPVHQRRGLARPPSFSIR